MANYHDIKYNVDYAGLAGALMPLATSTASSSATVSFTSGIDSTYDEYLIIYNNVHQATDGEKLTFQGTTDGTNFNVTMTSTVWYTYSTESGGGQSTTYHTGSDLAQATGYQPLNAGGGGSDNDQCCAGWIKLYKPSDTTFVKHFVAHQANYQDSDYSNDGHVAGYFNTTSAITGISFKFGSGNIDAGTFQLFGVH
jgi:hypothetical protein